MARVTKKAKKPVVVTTYPDGLFIYCDFDAIRALPYGEKFDALKRQTEVKTAGRVMYGFYEHPRSPQYLPFPDFFLIVDSRYDNRLIAIKFVDEVRRELKDDPAEQKLVRDRLENEAHDVAAHPDQLHKWGYTDLRLRGRQNQALFPEIYGWWVCPVGPWGAFYHVTPFDWRIFREMAMQFLASSEAIFDFKEYPHIQVSVSDGECGSQSCSIGSVFDLKEQQIAALRCCHGASLPPPFSIPEIDQDEAYPRGRYQQAKTKA